MEIQKTSNITLDMKYTSCNGPRRSTPAATDHAEVWPRGATHCPRSGAAAKRSYPMSGVRGGGQECQAAMVQERP